jgi:undecaprenyl-phosphate 4-deoxy-4-formamido-L-arabinose transferase
MRTGADVHAIDNEDLHRTREDVHSFFSECANRFDGPKDLLEIAPEGEGVAQYFRQARIVTLDADRESAATYIADICGRNEGLLPSGSFDLVVCTEALARVPEPFAAVREIHRLLRPGGHALIITPLNVGVERQQPDYWRFTEHGVRLLLKDFSIVSFEKTVSEGRPLMPLQYRVIVQKEARALPPASDDAAPEFSALITCYYEEKSIEEFHSRLSKALSSLGRSYEIIFVNDGSTDGTFEKLKGIFQRDPNVTTIIDLFRNAGQLGAITAAFCEARGKAILLMDSDLQLAPEDLPLLVAAYDKGYDVVTGARVNRKDSIQRKIPSKLANMIMRKATRSEFRDFGCTFKIFNAALPRAFNFGPHHLFSIVDLIARAGRRCEVPVSHFPRKYGKSGWTFYKLMKYNTDNLVIMSERPFQMLAAACLIVAMLFCVRIALAYVFPFRILGSISTGLLLNAIVISLLVTVGVLSLIGEFTIRVFLTGRDVPAYVIREIHRRG